MRVVGVDTETWRIQPGRVAPKLVCLQWCEGDQGAVLHRDAPDADTPSALVFFRQLLEDPDVMLIGANITYEMGVMAQHDPSLLPLIFAAYDAKRVRDVLIRQKLHKIALGEFKYDENGKFMEYNLEAVTKELLGVDVEGKHGKNAWRTRYHELDQVPVSEWPEEAYNYALMDAVYTERVWQEFVSLEDKLPTKAGMFDLEAQCANAWWMHLMHAWGIRSDGKAIDLLQADVSHNIDEAMPKLLEAGIFRPDGTKNTKRLQELVTKAYEEIWLPVPMTEPTSRFPQGQVKTAKETMAESGDPLLIKAAEIASEKSILSGAIPLLRKAETLPFNPWWNVLVETGRTSCGSDEDPGNLQNQRRRGGVRECWVPRKGWIFVDADYSQAELCSLAQVLLDMFGESKMAEALQAGMELHLLTASAILEISYEECKRRYEEGDQTVKDTRQLAKCWNFGKPGGLGKVNFIKFAKDNYGVILTMEQVTENDAKYFALFPEMRWYFKEIKSITKYGYATIQQVRSGRVRGGVTYPQAANGYFQALIADGAKAAGYEISKECYVVPSSPLYGCRIVAFVHDEFILEAPIAKARAAAKRLSEIMVQVMRKFIPDIPVEAKECLMRRWWKSAEQRKNEQGLLVPWEPPHPSKLLKKGLAAKVEQLQKEAAEPTWEARETSTVPDVKAVLRSLMQTTGWPLDEVLSGKRLPEAAWYSTLATEIKGHSAQDWHTACSQYELEQAAIEQEKQLGFGGYW